MWELNADKRWINCVRWGGIIVPGPCLEQTHFWSIKDVLKTCAPTHNVHTATHFPAQHDTYSSYIMSNLVYFDRCNTDHAIYRDIWTTNNDTLHINCSKWYGYTLTWLYRRTTLDSNHIYSNNYIIYQDCLHIYIHISHFVRYLNHDILNVLSTLTHICHDMWTTTLL